MTDRSSLDVAALVLVGAFTVLSLVAGSRASGVVDIDQVTYERTLERMDGGAGYYEAMAASLEEVRGSPVTSARSIRLPTEFWLLDRFPLGWLRGLATIPMVLTMLVCLSLGRRVHDWGGLVAVAVSGLWMVAAAPHLYLHAELWGLPLFLGGVALVDRGREWPSAMLILLAVLFRELYVIPLLVGLLVRRRLAWRIASVAVLVVGVLHTRASDAVLAAHGSDPRVGIVRLDLAQVLDIVSPGTTVFAWVVGVAALVGGLAGLAVVRRDGRAVVVLATAAVMIPASIWSGRVYWSLTWAPAVGAFAAPGWAVMRQRVLPSQRRIGHD